MACSGRPKLGMLSSQVPPPQPRPWSPERPMSPPRTPTARRCPGAYTPRSPNRPRTRLGRRRLNSGPHRDLLPEGWQQSDWPFGPKTAKAALDRALSLKATSTIGGALRLVAKTEPLKTEVGRNDRASVGTLLEVLTTVARAASFKLLQAEGQVGPLFRGC